MKGHTKNPKPPFVGGQGDAARIRMDSTHRRRVRVADVEVRATQYELDQVADLLTELARKPEAANHLLRILRTYY